MAGLAKRIPNLDGIRALAALTVVAAHAGYSSMAPAALAVTVFFFLSGFLITTQLRCEWETNTSVDFGRFFARRILRLYPPLCIAIALAACLTLFGYSRGRIEWVPLIFQLCYLSNYYTEFLAPSFGVSILQGTNVLWSLAIEAHFYLIFPILYLALARRLSRSRQALTFAAICAGVIFWRFCLFTIWGAGEHRIHFCTDTRIDSILYGCILAVWCNPVLDRSRPLRWSIWKIAAVLAICLAMLALSLFYRDPLFRSSLRYTVQGVALFPMFYLTIAAADHPFFHWLSWSPLAALGKLSYSLYLIHSPIQEAMKYSLSDITSFQVFLYSLPLSIGMSAAIYHWCERPLVWVPSPVGVFAAKRPGIV